MNLHASRLVSGLLALAVASQLCVSAGALEPSGQPASSGDVVITQTFSDPKLQTWLLDEKNLGGAGADGKLTLEERQSITELNVSGLGLNSLEGLDVFFNLQILNCSYNSLKELDLSGTPKLTQLNCSYNQLTKLDCSGLDQMIGLNCEMNRLTELNLSGCTALKSLYCRNNLLTSLNLQDNTALEFIETFSNYLTSIQVGHLSRLRFLHIDHNRLTELDLRGLQALEGGGFVAKNNWMETIYLPDQPGLTIYLEDYDEQDPIEGHDRVAWYLDPTFQTPVTGDLEAAGQILYSQRIPNRYTIYFSANGSSGSMNKMEAQWGEQVTLPANGFVRSGYTFSHWSVLSNGQTYPDQGQVSNLAGQDTDADSVTLYAQWTPNPYTIQFDSNGGSGVMDSMAATYGTPIPLTENKFTNGSMEFAGWSLTPGVPVRYPNQAQVQYLTTQYGGTVTLYAVWRTPLSEQQKPYLAQVEAAFQSYGAAGDEPYRYTAQDWSDLCEAYARAVSGIQQAALPEGMETAKNRGLREMAQVPTIEARIAEVTAGWKNANSQVLSYLNTPSLDPGNAALVEELIQGALDSLEQDQLGRYCPLSQETDRAQVLGAAAAELQAARESLLTLEQAAQWLTGLGDLPRRPLEQVYGEDLAGYQNALSGYQALDSQQKAYLSASVEQSLSLRYQLASQKYSAALALRQAYEALDLTAYSQDRQAALARALSQGLEAIRAAASVDGAQEAHRQAWEAITQIPTLDQEPVTPPDSGNPGGGSGGGGGAGGGGGGGGVVVSYTITSSAQAGGSISPSGVVHVTAGGSQSFAITPDAGYRIRDVQVDGKSVGQVAQYTFSNVAGHHTIAAYFEQETGEEIPDEDSHPFDDVPAGAWYEAAVTYAYRSGLMKGTSEGQFSPQVHLSRAMIVQILYNREHAPASSAASFPDVPQGQWYTGAVTWAAELGIVSGYDNGFFGPDDQVTREQLAVILHRYAQHKGYDTAQEGDLSAFPDSSSTSAWAGDALAWAVGHGVMSGKGDGTLDPTGTATRAEVAQMLMNYFNASL